jgi:hypothetical protein
MGKSSIVAGYARSLLGDEFPYRHFAPLHMEMTISFDLAVTHQYNTING